MKHLALLLALIASPCSADGLKFDPWTREDTARQIALTAVSLADWSQTVYIAEHTCARTAPGERCYRETGVARSFIGENPSVGQVNNYFAASILASAAVAYVLPARYRPLWQYGGMVYEGYFVIQNNRIGIKFSALF